MHAPFTHTPSARRHAARILAKLTATAALTGCLAAFFLGGTVSAFNAVTVNASNGVSAGSVTIADNDAGTAALPLLSNAKPGDSATGCVVVTYSGSAPSTVVLYGTRGGTAGQYVDLKVTRGTISGTPTAGSCLDFTADLTNYIGQGAGIVYNATLAGWPATSGAGLVDPLSGSARTWVQGESHAYRIQVTLQNNPAAQGKSATQTFTWEAANT